MNKLIVITGGSNGLGKTLTENLSKENNVIILSTNEEKLKIVADTNICKYKVCDGSDYNKVENVIKEIVNEYGKIDVLINNAGLWIQEDSECSAYCCSASAINTLSKCAAIELSDYNIRVNTVSPAFTPTPLSVAGWTPKEIKEKEQRNPRHRLGKVEDTANAVLFLLSDESDYINGENIKVNGGSLLK